MPTYDYRCTKCKHVFELFHSMSDDTPRRCPRCKARAVRVPSGGAGLIFKGSGFYITDYRSKSYKDAAKQDKAAGTESTSGGDAKGGGDPKPTAKSGGDSKPPSKGGDDAKPASKGKAGPKSRSKSE
jgi:putative FmdB family regulatory protein